MHCSRAAIVILTTLPPAAWGQTSSSNAEQLFQLGRQALLDGNYDAACNQLMRSDELDPAPGTKLNLSECETLRGRIATAWQLLKLVETELTAGDVRLPIARSKREALESRVPKLQLVLADGAPRETRVQIGGRQLDPSANIEAIPLDPGVVTLVVTAPGHPDSRTDVLLKEGQATRVVVAPAPRAERTFPAVQSPDIPHPSSTTLKPSPPAGNAARSASSSRESTSANRPGMAILTVGIVSTVLGGVAGIMALDARSTNQQNCSSETQSCNQAGRDAAHRGRVLGPISTVGLVLGGVGISIGSILLVKSHRESSHAPRLWLYAADSGTSVAVEQSF